MDIKQKRRLIRWESAPSVNYSSCSLWLGFCVWMHYTHLVYYTSRVAQECPLSVDAWNLLGFSLQAWQCVRERDRKFELEDDPVMVRRYSMKNLQTWTSSGQIWREKKQTCPCHRKPATFLDKQQGGCRDHQDKQNTFYFWIHCNFKMFYFNSTTSTIMQTSQVLQWRFTSNIRMRTWSQGVRRCQMG